MEPNCQNIMCSECLLTWIKNHSTCPLCRIETDVSKFVYIKNEKDIKPITEQHVLDNIPSTKVDTVIKIIRNKPKGKIIVFSEHDQTFTPIRNILSTHNISFGEIKGTVETRDNLIQKFKNGSIQVIFLNANFNGAGINLQETTDIIVFHEMENNLLTQIVGRANRIGRTIPLNLHYLQL
jgi:SNF2 family DNA or RNA helicase